MMKRTPSALPVMLVSAAFAWGTMAQATMPASSTKNKDTINGIAITPGAERLSCIANTYYGIRPAYDVCVKETQGRVVDQGDCADAEFRYQDERLNKAYKSLTTHLSGIGKQAAVDAHRAWLAFFAKDCATRASGFGANNALATESICHMKNTAIRAQQLEDWLSSPSASQSH